MLDIGGRTMRLKEVDISLVLQGRYGCTRLTRGVTTWETSKPIIELATVRLRADTSVDKNPFRIERCCITADGVSSNASGAQVGLAAINKIRSRLAEEVLHS